MRFRGYTCMTLAAAWLLASLLAPAAKAQLNTWTKEQMVDYTKNWTGERFPDGRPKVSDEYIQRAKGLSQEEITIPGGRGGGGGYTQYEGDFRVLHPETHMAGRAFTMQFMPVRADLDTLILGKAKEKGFPILNNQTALDMLQPGDVLVVDLFGKKDGGTIVGDNLFYYVMKATKGGGIVVDGAFRDLDGIADMPMPAYFRSVHPSYLTQTTASLSGINVPIRIGGVTVVPGDLVVGDKEGVAFIPPHNVEQILDRADDTHIHDQWTRLKFDEGKYKSSEIYSSPKDPALLKEYNEYKVKRLAELKAGRTK